MNLVGSKKSSKGRREINPSDVLATIPVGGKEIQVVKNSFDTRRGTLHTIKLAGLGKDSIFGPQKFLALLGACAKAARFFEDKEQIELTEEQYTLLEQVEAIVGDE